jgi:hypothetical protein
VKILLSPDPKGSQIILDDKYGQTINRRNNYGAFQIIPFVNAMIAFLSIKATSGFQQDSLKVLPTDGNDARQNSNSQRDLHTFFRT